MRFLFSGLAMWILYVGPEGIDTMARVKKSRHA